jgi:hypothetical protein
MTQMADILDQVQAALVATSPGTAAGQAVYTPGDWPTVINTYPLILLSVVRERKQSLGKNGPPEFIVTATVRISGRVSAPPAAADGGGGVAEQALWALGRQIEIAVINYPPLWQMIEQLLSSDAELAFSSEGAEHIAQVNYDLEFEYYQGPEDFYPFNPVPLQEVDLTLSNFETPSGEDISALILVPQS